MTTVLQASSSQTIPHVIAGRQVTTSQRVLERRSPVDGRLLGAVGLADTSMIDHAVAEARTAFQSWSATPIKERVQPLYRFKQLVELHIKELSALVTSESGKTPAEAEAGIRKGLEVVEYAAAVPYSAPGKLLQVSRGVDCYSRTYPLGVVAGITPFNFPAMVPMWMFPLAIAMGNTFIHKPSERVPLTPVRLAELLDEAGLPAGVFNVVQGDRSTVEGLLDHPEIKAAAFVGSTAVARQVYHRGITAGKRMLALGGAKNHVVVMPDADPDLTAKNVVASAMGCAGQRCMAASVLITVGDCRNILDRIVAEASRIHVGQEMGAIISREALQRILGYIERAVQEGATLLLDGREPLPAISAHGNYLGPTVIGGLKAFSEASCDEIFGPVLSVIQVSSLEEALAIENESPYGNAASIYTSAGATAAFFEERANAGMIGINIGVPVPREPFSFGGWNHSIFGNGDITGEAGIMFWSKSKKITRKWSAPSSGNWMS